jgi:enoyl-CoA hydratase/carnithine racemase
VGAQEAERLHLAQRVAPAAEAEAAAVELARQLCANDGPGLRRLKRMFADHDDTAARVARENAALVEFQAQGAGLPQRRK